MPYAKTHIRSLATTPAKLQNAYLPPLNPDMADALRATVHHWYNAFNNGTLATQPAKNLLQSAHHRYLQQLMTALGIPSEKAAGFKNTLRNFNGSLEAFITAYEKNNIFLAAEQVRISRAISARNAQREKMLAERNAFSKFYHRIKGFFKTQADKILDDEIQQEIHNKKAKIIAYKNEYIKEHHKALRNVAVSLPFISLWSLGLKAASEPIIFNNDNFAQTTFVAPLPNANNRVLQANQQAGILELTPKQSNTIDELTHSAANTVCYLFQKVANDIKTMPAITTPKTPTVFVDQNYVNELTAQKDKDLAEFTQLYRQCSYSNYLKLCDGYKKSTFKAANRTLRNHGIKPLHPRLYCSGMSIASLCQAQDIFKQKHPDSYIIPAIDEILKNCRNVHHCATLKKDLRKITNNYTLSYNPQQDIKNYMQTHDNAILFLWTPRGGGNFHHQTFFQPKENSSNLYTFTSFNSQRWGNENDFSGFISARSKNGIHCYYTDISKGIDDIANKYIQRDAVKHQKELAMASLSPLFHAKIASRS